MTRSFSLNALALVGLSLACAPAGPSVGTPSSGATPPDTVTRASSGALARPAEASARDSMATAALVASGREAYRRQYCGLCHRLDAAETSGEFGPTHNGMGVTAGERIRDPSYTGIATTPEAYIRESILDPDGYIVPGYGGSRFRMPAYTHLDEAEVEALVQMLLEER